MSQIREILEFIAKTSLFGIFPLDIIMHFIVGASLLFLFLKTFKKLLPTFLGILFLAILKELFDWDIMMRNKFYFEPIKDIIVTLLGAVFLLFILRRNNREKPSTISP